MNLKSRGKNKLQLKKRPKKHEKTPDQEKSPKDPEVPCGVCMHSDTKFIVIVSYTSERIYLNFLRFPKTHTQTYK